MKSSQRQHVTNRLQRQCHGTILAVECFVNTTCNGSLPHWSRKSTAAICRMRNATDQKHPFVAQVPSSEQLSGTSMFIHGIATFPVNDMPTCCCWIQDIGVSLNQCLSGTLPPDLTEKPTRFLCGTNTLGLQHPERLMQFDPKVARDQCNLVSQPMAASEVGECDEMFGMQQ